MTTQTLRGMATHGAMHWRGDRADGFFGREPARDPDGPPCDEDLAFQNFIVAFEGLVGRDGPIAAADMQEFTDFMLAGARAAEPDPEPRQLAHRRRSRTAATRNVPGDPPTRRQRQARQCNGCHTLDPAQGFFGTDGDQTFESETQNFKIAAPAQRVPEGRHVRDPGRPGHRELGPQVRGFGFLHDGRSTRSVFRLPERRRTS